MGKKGLWNPDIQDSFYGSSPSAAATRRLSQSRMRSNDDRCMIGDVWWVWEIAILDLIWGGMDGDKSKKGQEGRGYVVLKMSGKGTGKVGMGPLPFTGESSS